MFRIVLHEPEIPPNTGNVMRLAAVPGCSLDIIEPLGFTLEDRKLLRAGLDYRDRAVVAVHPDLDAWRETVGPSRVWAYTVNGEKPHTEVEFEPGDSLMFARIGGPGRGCRERPGSPGPCVSMIPNVDLNLSNAVAVAVYEAWRQNGFSHPDA